MPDAFTTDTEVEGSIVYVIHVDDSGTDPVRTVLSLLTKDDLTLTVEEEEEELNLATQRRTRRYRTHNTADLEVSSAIDVDMEAMELVGFVDSTDGSLGFATDDRRLGADEYIEIAYFDHENADYVDAQLVHRFSTVEATSPEVDMSETPPLLSWTFWIHGDIVFNYDDSA